MRQTPRNILFILQLDRKGVPPGIIYERCKERLVWDGPLPSMNDILHVTRTPPARAVASGPDREAVHDAGRAPAGKSGPDASI